MICHESKHNSPLATKPPMTKASPQLTWSQQPSRSTISRMRRLLLILFLFSPGCSGLPTFRHHVYLQGMNPEIMGPSPVPQMAVVMLMMFAGAFIGFVVCALLCASRSVRRPSKIACRIHYNESRQLYVLEAMDKHHSSLCELPKCKRIINFIGPVSSDPQFPTEGAFYWERS